jgi:hypothetical protein
MDYRLFTNILNGPKTTFPKPLERSACYLSNKLTNEEAANVHHCSIVRVVIVVLSAYAGSALASVQFPDLPEPTKMAQQSPL